MDDTTSKTPIYTVLFLTFFAGVWAIVLGLSM